MNEKRRFFFVSTKLLPIPISLKLRKKFFTLFSLISFQPKCRHHRPPNIRNVIYVIGIPTLAPPLRLLAPFLLSLTFFNSHRECAAIVLWKFGCGLERYLMAKYNYRNCFTAFCFTISTVITIAGSLLFISPSQIKTFCAKC